MGGRKRVQAAAEAEPKVEVGAGLGAELAAEAGAGAEAEAPVQAKAPPKAPTRASTTKTPIKPRSKKRGSKKRIRAPHVMPSPAEALRALTEELTVTVDDAAVLLKLSRHYAYKMVEKGEIPSIRLGQQAQREGQRGGVIRIPSAALRTMLQLEVKEAAE